jgi:hypothetical protein
MKRYKQRAERRLQRKSKKVFGKLPWDEAVTVLTGALTQAIWHEGGEIEDAIATAEIVYTAICRDLHSWSTLENRDNPKNVIPIRRKKGYLRNG